MHNAAQTEMAGQTGASSLRATGTEAVLDRVPYHAPSQVKLCLQNLQASEYQQCRLLIICLAHGITTCDS